jgi:hypothetical protein
MTALTGRTVFRWTTLIIEDTGSVLREIPISSLTALGLKYDEVEVTAWQDAIKARLPAMPDFVWEWSGPFDTSAAAAVGAGLSGSHTVLAPLLNFATPGTIYAKCGVRHPWEAGEPVFGAENTFIVTEYTVDMANGSYKARAVYCPSATSTVPAWGTAALAA